MSHRIRMIALAGVAGVALASAPAIAAAAPLGKTPVVYGFDGHRGFTAPEREPGSVVPDFGLDGIRVSGLHWAYWLRRHAYASSATILACTPACVSRPGTAGLHVVLRHHGQAYFAELTVRWAGHARVFRFTRAGQAVFWHEES